MVFWHKGENDKALEWYQGALDGQEVALGKDHPRTLETVYKIATLFRGKGEYDKALEWYQRALDGWEKALGKYHPRTLEAVHNIATVLRDKGENDKALEWYQRALDSRGMVLGKGHPHTLAAVNNMATKFQNYLGGYDKAMVWYKRTLDGWESANTEDKGNLIQAGYHGLEAGISKSNISRTNSDSTQVSQGARGQAGPDISSSVSDGNADSSGSEPDISENGSIISVIFRIVASQSSGTSINQVPPKAREQAEDAIADVLAKCHGVSVIVEKGEDKPGQQGVEKCMTMALRQFTAAIKPSLGKKPLLMESLRFIEVRAARKIRESTQSQLPAVRDKPAITKYLEDMHSHKVLFSERIGDWHNSSPDTLELAKSSSSEIKLSHEPDTSAEPLTLRGPGYIDGEELELETPNEEGESRSARRAPFTTNNRISGIRKSFKRFFDCRKEEFS